jgi:hypothetical protein
MFKKLILFSNFKSNPYLKKLVTIIMFMVPLYFMMVYFEILPDHLYLVEFILARLILVLRLLQILLDLPIAKGFQKELQIFNRDLRDKPFLSFFIRLY